MAITQTIPVSFPCYQEWEQEQTIPTSFPCQWEWEGGALTSSCTSVEEESSPPCCPCFCPSSVVCAWGGRKVPSSHTLSGGVQLQQLVIPLCVRLAILWKVKWQDLKCLQAVSNKTLSFQFFHSNANHTHTNINKCIHVVYAQSYLVSRLHKMQRVSLECDTGNMIFRWLTLAQNSICLLFHFTSYQN